MSGELYKYGKLRQYGAYKHIIMTYLVCVIRLAVCVVQRTYDACLTCRVTYTLPSIYKLKQRHIAHSALNSAIYTYMVHMYTYYIDLYSWM